MTLSLIPFFQAIAHSKTEAELRCTVMDHLPHHFEAERRGLYLLNGQKQLASVDVIGVSDTFVERYETIGRPVDRVMDYVLEHHTPAHEALVFPAGGWKQSELFQRCCSHNEHAHILTGPIVGGGHIVGTIHFARGPHTPAFDTLDLSRMGAVCSHISAQLSSLRHASCQDENLFLQRLTSREQEVAKLVAKGFTNRKIASELWITQNTVKQTLKRMFRKLEVSSRTEMVAKLSDRTG